MASVEADKAGRRRWGAALALAVAAALAWPGCDSVTSSDASTTEDADAASSDGGCRFDRDCGAGQVCDPQSRQCVGCLADELASEPPA